MNIILNILFTKTSPSGIPIDNIDDVVHEGTFRIEYDYMGTNTCVKRSITNPTYLDLAVIASNATRASFSNSPYTYFEGVSKNGNTLVLEFGS